MKTKSFKCLLSVFVILIITCFALSFVSINKTYADEVESGEPVPSVACKVVIEQTEHGVTATSISEGDVGEIVTIIPTPDVLYAVKSVYVNGVAIDKVENKYSFVLTEGDNVVSVLYVMPDELAWIRDNVQKAKEGDWASIFSLSNLSQIISWVIAGGGIIGLCFTLLKMKKTKTMTTEDVTKQITTLLKEQYGIVISDLFQQTLSPILDKILSGINDVEEVCKVLARCIVLAQENTPEARMAIIAELTNLKASDNDLIVKVRDLINTELQKNKAIEEEKAKTLKELEDINNSIETTEPVSDAIEEVEEYGQI